MKKKLLIFDLDGTLVNSVSDLTAAVNETLKSFTQKEYTDDQVKPWIGNGVELLVKRALSGSTDIAPDLNEEDVKQATDLYLKKYAEQNSEQTVLYPNVIQTLKDMQNRGFTLALVTNKPHRFVDKLLHQVKLESFFTTAIGANFLAEKKPHAMPLIWTVKKNGFKPSESVMIGDSRNDILAAQNANMDSIGVSYGYNYNQSIEDSNPTLVIHQFEELIDNLQYG